MVSTTDKSFDFDAYLNVSHAKLNQLEFEIVFIPIADC